MSVPSLHLLCTRTPLPQPSQLRRRNEVARPSPPNVPPLALSDERPLATRRVKRVGLEAEFVLSLAERFKVALLVNPDIVELFGWETDCSPVKLSEASLLDAKADDGDAGRVAADVLLETPDGEEEVLVRVESEGLGGCSRKVG